jgi:hypothetical protein
VKAARLEHCRKLTLPQTAQLTLPSVQTDRPVHCSKHILEQTARLGSLLYLMQTAWLVRCKLIFTQRLDGYFILWKQLGGDTEINSFQQRQIDWRLLLVCTALLVHLQCSFDISANSSAGCSFSIQIQLDRYTVRNSPYAAWQGH